MNTQKIEELEATIAKAQQQIEALKKPKIDRFKPKYRDRYNAVGGDSHTASLYYRGDAWDAAWSKNECACPDVDWTPEEVYELSKQLKALQDAIEAIDPFDSSFEVDNAFEPEFICRCWHCDMEGNYTAEVKHTLDCPVTKLRGVLKSQEVSDE